MHTDKNISKSAKLYMSCLGSNRPTTVSMKQELHDHAQETSIYAL